MENNEKPIESNEKQNKSVDSFAKNLEKTLENQTNQNDDQGKSIENNGNAENNEGWTIRSLLDCFGVADWQALLALSDKKVYEIALKNYPKEVRKNCGAFTGISSSMANFRAKTIEKLMKKYSYNIDIQISDELACMLAMGFAYGSIITQAKFTADKIQEDLDILEKKEVKDD